MKKVASGPPTSAGSQNESKGTDVYLVVIELRDAIGKDLRQIKTTLAKLSNCLTKHGTQPDR